MRQRCNNPKSAKFHLYGGKGISVCPEWEDFEAFYQWSMQNGYEENLTIDRIDGNGDYCPENCRWATYEDQARNTSQNRILSHKGKSLPLVVWAERIGMQPTTLRQRLDRYNWPVGRALETPVYGGRQ